MFHHPPCREPRIYTVTPGSKRRAHDGGRAGALESAGIPATKQTPRCLRLTIGGGMMLAVFIRMRLCTLGRRVVSGEGCRENPVKAVEWTAGLSSFQFRMSSRWSDVSSQRLQMARFGEAYGRISKKSDPRCLPIAVCNVQLQFAGT